MEHGKIVPASAPPESGPRCGVERLNSLNPGSRSRAGNLFGHRLLAHMRLWAAVVKLSTLATSQKTAHLFGEHPAPPLSFGAIMPVFRGLTTINTKKVYRPEIALEFHFFSYYLSVVFA